MNNNPNYGILREKFDMAIKYQKRKKAVEIEDIQ